jgi:hypothetical protein
MYVASVPPIIRSLTNLRAILEKAAAHADAKKIDPSVLVNARLYPDMYPLSRQVQIATDVAKGAVSRLAGLEPPKYEDNESTFPELSVQKIKLSRCRCTTKRSPSPVRPTCTTLFYPMSISTSLPSMRFCDITAWNLASMISWETSTNTPL